MSLLSACRDETPTITAPGAAARYSVGGAQAVEISCKVAVRTPADRYVMRPFTIEAPAGIADPGSDTISFGMYGWTDGATDPRRITVCEIPNTPAAQQWIRRTLLSEEPELNLTHPNESASDVARRVAERVASARPRSTGAGITVNMVEPISCDSALMDQCSCDPTAITCDGWTPIEEDIGPEPPPPPVVEDLNLGTPDPLADYVAGPNIITCRNQTQYPHISGFDVSVHGQTNCDFPVSTITLRVALSKQRCLLVLGEVLRDANFTRRLQLLRGAAARPLRARLVGGQDHAHGGVPGRLLPSGREYDHLQPVRPRGSLVLTCGGEAVVAPVGVPDA